MQVLVGGKKSIPATRMVRQFMSHHSDLQRGMPSERYGGIMDCVCSLSSGEIALVEMQVVPQDYWDRRSLAYASSIYCRQLVKGMMH